MANSQWPMGYLGVTYIARISIISSIVLLSTTIAIAIAIATAIATAVLHY